MEGKATGAAVLASLDGELHATVPEAAAILRCDRRTITEMCVNGEIPATRAGNRWRIRVDYLRQQAGVAA